MAWTRAVSDDRRRNELEPHTRCKPSGGPRQWLTPYGAEFLELLFGREDRRLTRLNLLGQCDQLV